MTTAHTAGLPRQRLRSGFDLDNGATFSGSIDLRFTVRPIIDLAVSGTPFTGGMLWSRSASRSLSLYAAAMRLEPVGIPIQGPGRIQQTFNFRAEPHLLAHLVFSDGLVKQFRIARRRRQPLSG